MGYFVRERVLFVVTCLAKFLVIELFVLILLVLRMMIMMMMLMTLMMLLS